MILFMSSCGGHMDDWPYCDLPDSVANYDSVTIEIIEKDTKDAGKIITNEKYFSNHSEIVLDFYDLIENMHVSPKSTNQTFEKYWQKVSIFFEMDDLNYTFEYYELSMTDGYFVFDFKETHNFKGDFYGVVLNAITKNADKLRKL